MATARYPPDVYQPETRRPNPFVPLLNVKKEQNIVDAYEYKAERKHKPYNPFLHDESPASTDANGGDALTLVGSLASSSSTNPFLVAASQGHGAAGVPGVFMHLYPAPNVPVGVHYVETNPFSTVHVGSFVHSTPVAPKPEVKTLPMLHPYINTEESVKHGHADSNHPFYSSRSAPRHPSPSDSDEDYDRRERVPTLRPGQYDVSTPWREFLHRFESCAEANHWSAKTMAIQLKFCLTGAAGAIVHRNPRSSRWDYRRLLEELETAYGPSSDHAAAVAVELRQRLRKPGEALHVFRDDIYGKVAVAYGDWSEAEQDAIAVEVFTNGLGDAELVQRLLEKRPATLARAYEVAHSFETTKRAASYVTSAMQQGARNLAERRPRAAVVRERDLTETVTAPTPAPNFSPSYSAPFMAAKAPKQHNNFDKGDIRCFNCDGWGHKQNQCSSPRRNTRTSTRSAPHGQRPPTVLHLKDQSREMSIHLRMCGAEVCAVLDSGARRSVYRCWVRPT